MYISTLMAALMQFHGGRCACISLSHLPFRSSNLTGKLLQKPDSWSFSVTVFFNGWKLGLELQWQNVDIVRYSHTPFTSSRMWQITIYVEQLGESKYCSSPSGWRCIKLRGMNAQFLRTWSLQYFLIWVADFNGSITQQQR